MADISFQDFQDKIDEWYSENFIGDPPIDAQFALDLIFEALVNSKYNYPYLTTMTECTEQVNSIKLDLILAEYSKEYREFKTGEKEGSSITVSAIKRFFGR